MRSVFVLITTILLIGADPHLARAAVLDNFEDVSGWGVLTSEGTRLEIAQDTGPVGKAMRLDFDFQHGIGFVVARKAFAMHLPENFEFRFHLRGDAAPNNFQFKLVDSENNVWWLNRPNFNFPKEAQEIVIKKRHLQFAWGPVNGKTPKDVIGIEFAIATGMDGRGSIWIDNLKFEPLEPMRAYTLTPTVQASTSTGGHEPERILDNNGDTSWRSGSLAEDQWLLIDFLQRREYGGLVIDWDQDDYATAYQVQVSDDGEQWQTLYSVNAGNGGRDYIYMPDAESRYVRLALQKSSRSRGYDISSVTVKALDFSRSSNHFFAAIAKDAPRGVYPKYFQEEQSYWTLVGVDGDHKEGLLNEEGMLEVDKGSFSIEPFFYKGEKLITWNDVKPVQELEKGYLPIPSVIWKHEEVNLKVTAFAAGEPGKSSLYARYRVENISPDQQHVNLFLAIRPFQVNPPWQSLNTTGGTSNIHELSLEGRTVWVNKDYKAITTLTTPDRFRTVAFDQGSITDYLLENKLPPQTSVSDPTGYASGALEYYLDLPPRSAQEIYLVIPFYEAKPVVAANISNDEASAIGRKQFEQAKSYWEDKLNRVGLQLPPAAEAIVNTLKTTLAYIMINRDGPGIQPGSRTYARSWIRDGAMTSSALLGMGYTEEVRDFIKWYAQYQFANGKIPCCVDWRGADPTVEHDSHGEFIYLVMEYYRYTRDVGFLKELWPYIVKTVDYIDSLRQQRLTDAYKTELHGGACYGLVPESISHEGYSAAPQHSYWDDFFILRGLKDAASIAVILGEEEKAASLAALRNTFRKDLYASLDRTMAIHHINYIPGCVELGDFDATSTTIAIDPGGELSSLPKAALNRTFDHYYENFHQRKYGKNPWANYTPYELRVVGILARLGQKARAHEALDYFLKDRRPAAWNQWAEVVWRDPKTPAFIGDMPHTWAGSDFIRSIRSLFVYESEADQALVIAAGVPSSWVLDPNGVSVKRLPTYHGTLNYTLRSPHPHELHLRLSGDLVLPSGKIIFKSPLGESLQGVTVNGKEITTFTADSAIIDEFPAEVVLHYGSQQLSTTQGEQR